MNRQIIGIAAAGLLLLTACSTEEQGYDAVERGDLPPTSEEATPEETTGVLGLEDKASWNGGLSVQLSHFKRGKSSGTAAPENVPFIQFRISVETSGTDPVDMSMAMLSCGGGEEVFDSAQELNSTPSSHVIPRVGIWWNAACTLALSETDAQIEFTPNGSDTAIFAGRLP